MSHGHSRGVYRFPAPGDAVRLVGIKANGDLCFELTVPADDFHPALEARAWRWLDRMDAPLRLISSSD